jgi:hypothetical protein
VDGGHVDLSGGTVIGTCRGLGMRSETPEDLQSAWHRKPCG